MVHMQDLLKAKLQINASLEHCMSHVYIQANHWLTM